MELRFGHIAFFRLLGAIRVKNPWFIPLIIVGCITISSVLSRPAGAAELKPTCTSGYVFGKSEESTQYIYLNCNGVYRFAKSGTTAASEDDLNAIVLHPQGSMKHPFEATISGGQLLMRFYKTDGFVNRDITIFAGALLGEDGTPNDQISLSTTDIVDMDTPWVSDDSYNMSGITLNIGAAEGVLRGDYDNEGAITARLLEPPQFGTVVMNSDGSFTYIYTAAEAHKTDSFTYIATDEAGNAGRIASVAINDGSPGAVQDMYRSGSGNKKYAKTGDEIVLEITANEPVVLSGANIAGRSVEVDPTDYNTHFFIKYVLQADDKEGLIPCSFNIVDRGGNTSYYLCDNKVRFDKTPPEIKLSGPAVIDINQYEFYDDDGLTTANDDVDGPIGVSVVGNVDTDQGGVYELTYMATDKAGNTAIIKRTVIVHDVTASDPTGNSGSDTPSLNVGTYKAQSTPVKQVEVAYAGNSTVNSYVNTNSGPSVLGKSQTNDSKKKGKANTGKQNDSPWKLFGFSWYWWPVALSLMTAGIVYYEWRRIAASRD